ncbi:MAG TPA: hypothetical protein PK867_11900, partial [Pirellulales bacterium]|nr:hypothetical protein [Pirellulales bacterium]
MTSVFLDTVGLVAMWNRSDQWHADARCWHRVRSSFLSAFTHQLDGHLHGADPLSQLFPHPVHV